MNCIKCNAKNRLVLQLHITARCNQKCLHCYHEKYNNDELTLEQIKMIITQYKELLVQYNGDNKVKGHINITGGEPFIRDDFFDILKQFHENKDYFSFGILTNGSFITDENCKLLKELGVSFIQVSIEGKPKTHNLIRGKDNFNKTINAIKLLNKYKIKSMISFTAHKDNYKEFSYVANYARRYKVFKLWTDRLVPIGNGKVMENKLLSPEELVEYLDIIKKEKDKTFLNKLSRTIISMERSLQFLKSGGVPYHCSAGKSLITILENGDVVPCRRMPIPTENVLNKQLQDIYFNNSVFKDLRTDREPEEGCSNCFYFSQCKGGSRCISYAINKNPYSSDPSCPVSCICNK